MKTHILVE